MLNMKWTMSAVMLAAAFAGTASQASAQSHYRGTFELPFEARFGKVVLQPGSYTVSTLEGTKGIRIMGERGAVSILAAGYDLKSANEKAKMVLVESGGIYTLQSFESGSMGTSFNFIIEKNPRGSVERAAVKQTIEVGMQ
jgi:hypothetical protein